MKSSTGWLAASAAVLAALFGSYLLNGGGRNNGPSRLYAQQVAEAQVAEEHLVGAEQLSSAFRAASKVLRPSVVQISIMVDQRQVQGRSPGRTPFNSPFGNDLLEEFFGDLQRRGIPRDRFEEQPESQEEPSESGRKLQAGMGSGVIVSQDGYILTNNHVVEHADELQVELSDDRTFKAKVVGTDPRSDLAVLKIDATGLVPARMGDSSAIEVGDWVIAVGSPFGLEQTVTAGIISATNRHTGIIRGGYEDFLQTDAAINPGNSGGPLVNLRGEVIGINTAINSRTGTSAGVGFAIPSNMAMRIMQDLQQSGHVLRGFIGAGLEDLKRDNASGLNLPPNVLRGAIIRRVLPNCPAAKAGLQSNDVVVATNGRPLTSSSQLMNEVALARPGASINMSVIRDGKPLDVNVVVEEQTEQKMSQFSNRVQIADWGLVVDTLNETYSNEELPEDIEQGAIVLAIEPRGRAARLGLAPGDVLVVINDKTIASADDAKEAFEKVEGQINIEFQRGPARTTVSATVR